MPFTFNAVDLYVLTFSGKPRIPLGRCAGHCSMKYQPDELSDIILVVKILGINIKW